MNAPVLITLGVVFSGMLLLLQRAQANRRLLVSLMLLPLFALCWVYASTSAAIRSAWLAFFFAILFNVLFWLIIGRYNPVAKSEDIRVLRMDD
ncbi:MAG: hypothetical protein OXG02_01660 [Chloroflexi bacterium]|nr:hypothetical protein [Chloroflexota bacterium]